MLNVLAVVRIIFYICIVFVVIFLALATVTNIMIMRKDIETLKTKYCELSYTVRIKKYYGEVCDDGDYDCDNIKCYCDSCSSNNSSSTSN